MADLIIIGAGPGGYETAIKAANNGLKTILVNEGPLGGVCLNEGCIPTKIFCNYAGKDSYEKVVERKNAIVRQLRAGIAYLLNNPLITLIDGRAYLKNDHTVVVGDAEYQADNIIIATGSSPMRLPIPGANMDFVLTSSVFLNLKNLPKQICLIGGGVIGVETACYFNKFGAEVTILESSNHIIPNFDEDISKKLQKSLTQHGIRIETSAHVVAISEDRVVTYVIDSDEYKLKCDCVLMAVGRKPRVAGINLEAVGIEYGDKGIIVNDYMQTSKSNIYAIGDVNGKNMLAHIATYQGYKAINHILKKADKISFHLSPSIIYSTPEVAVVGLSEAECIEEERDYRIIKIPYASIGMAIALGQQDGFCKLIVENGSNIILGCHIIGYNASNLIQEVVTMMSLNASVNEVQDIIHAHPSFSELIQAAIHSYNH